MIFYIFRWWNIFVISTNPQTEEKWKTYPQKQRCGNVENSL